MLNAGMVKHRQVTAARTGSQRVEMRQHCFKPTDKVTPGHELQNTLQQTTQAQCNTPRHPLETRPKVAGAFDPLTPSQVHKAQLAVPPSLNLPLLLPML
jgi:hypothetical protein